MKKVLMSAVVVMVMAAVVFLASCTKTPKAIPNEEAWSKFVGEWINPEKATGGDLYPAMQVYEADLVGKWFWYSWDAEPWVVYKFTPRKSWVDAEGHVYCQVHFQFAEIGRTSSTGECAGLMRIDKTGNVLEINAISGVSEHGSTADWAYKHLEEINPDLEKEIPSTGEKLGWSKTTWLSIYWIYYRK